MVAMALGAERQSGAGSEGGAGSKGQSAAQVESSRADRGSPDYACLRDSIIRLGRSIYIDEPKFIEGMRTHLGKAPAIARNPHGRGGLSSSGRKRKGANHGIAVEN